MPVSKTTISAIALLLASAGAAAAFPATVTTDLNVRSGPGTNFQVVDQLQAGETVDVTGTQGSWYQIAGMGWASASYLDAQGSAAVEDQYAEDQYAAAEPYPTYYGSPAFYYGSDPFFWDDGGYYWYWRAGRRHRIGWDWFRNHDHNRFRWSHNRDRDRFDNIWRRRIGQNDGPRRPRIGDNDGGRPRIVTGRASSGEGPRIVRPGGNYEGPRMVRPGGGGGGGDGPRMMRPGGGEGRGGGGGGGGGGRWLPPQGR